MYGDGFSSLLLVRALDVAFEITSFSLSFQAYFSLGSVVVIKRPGIYCGDKDVLYWAVPLGLTSGCLALGTFLLLVLLATLAASLTLLVIMFLESLSVRSPVAALVCKW